MPRIACLWVPDLPLCAAVRAEPQLATAPLAVVQAGDLGGRAHVLAATPAAFGVERGQTLAEARAICPALVHRQASAERERAAAQGAVEAAAAVSPRFAEASRGLVYLDADGLGRLARGEATAALAPRPSPARFEEGEEREGGVQSIDPLLFVWKALLDRLAQRLRARGLMAREPLLQLRLSNATWDERTLHLAA